MGNTPSLPALHAQEGSAASSILARCPSLHDPYTPPWLCQHASLHLITATVVQGVQNFHLRPRRELLTLEDGGNVSLDWWTVGRAKVKVPSAGTSAVREDPLFSLSGPATPIQPTGPPVVLILHVFSGHSKDGYVQSLAAWCLKKGWLPVSMNARGCGDLQLTSPKPAIPGLTDDVHAAVMSIKAQYPGSPVFGVGYSNGAYTLTKYLADIDAGRLSADGAMAGGVAAHSGFDYNVEMAKISDGKSILNIDFFERSYWHGYIQQHKKQLKKNTNVDWSAIKRAKSAKELEDHFVRPIWGFKDMETYHKEVNAIHLIPQIRTPLLFISAEDDLCLDMSIMPAVIAAVEASSHTALALTRLGSHCAHLRSGNLYSVNSLVDIATIEFFSDILLQTGHTQPQPDTTTGGDVTYLPASVVAPRAGYGGGLASRHKTHEQDTDGLITPEMARMDSAAGGH